MRRLDFFSSLRSLCALTVLLAFLLQGTQAMAAEFCVNGNVSFFSAMQQFEDGDEDTTIRLVQGFYSFPLDTWNEDASLAIVGGYTDTTCTTRSYNPGLTVLSLASGNPLLIAGQLELGSLTFRNFPGSINFFAQGSALGNSVLRLTRTRFEGPLDDGVHLEGDRVYLNEVIMTDSGSGDHFGNQCALNIEGPNDADDLVSIQHSTIATNPAHGVCIGDFFGNSDEGFDVWLDNNILYGNAMSLSLQQTSQYISRNNIIDGNVFEYGAANPGASGNNFPNNPLFVNAAAGDFRLQNASPAINSGRTTTFAGLPQFDIVGNPRWIGPAPDRGAHESAIDGTEVLTVTDAGDATNPVITGSLRWAIQQANLSQNYSIIRFNIPGACPRIILLGSDLPPINTPIGFDGYSQPGSSANTLDGGLFEGEGSNAVICVRIGGNGTPFGLRVPLSAGTNGRLGVSGLALGDFTQAAIGIEAGIGSSIVGNQIFLGQPIGIFVSGSADGTQIGGPDAWQRNIIQRSDYGIALNPPSVRATVENNLIGLDANGNGAANGNDIGIGISGHDNVVRDNAIAGNGGGVVIVDGDRNRITSNTFGLKVGGTGACGGLPPLPPCPPRDLPNTSHGVLIQGNATANVIENNSIANSGGAGIRATEGLRNRFFGNLVWNSGGLSIDLNAEGPDPFDNDGAPASATLANRGLNAPAFLNAMGQPRRGVLQGLLSSTNGSYVIQAWVSPSCDNAHREQRRLAGFGSVTISGAPAGGSAIGVFQLALNSPNNSSMVGQYITTVASDFDAVNGVSNTSESSLCRLYENDTIFTDGFD